MIVEPATDSPHYDSEALWQKLQGLDWRGRSVMVICGNVGRDWLARQLAGRGARVESVVTYRRTAPVWTAELEASAEEALARPSDHLWLFSSSEAIGHLIARYPAPHWASSMALATHPRVAQAARQAGFARVYTSTPTLPAIVACIQSAATAEKL
jgi:uroporphyrinogen-III synthase